MIIWAFVSLPALVFVAGNSGELTLPGKIFLEAEAGYVIFLYVGAPAPL